jgi:hypothetical protein
MAKKRKSVHPDAQKLMSKIKVGQCYWIKYMGFQIITSVTESHHPGYIRITTKTMSVNYADGSVLTLTGNHLICLGTLKTFGVRIDPKKFLARYNKAWKKIYQPKN